MSMQSRLTISSFRRIIGARGMHLASRPNDVATSTPLVVVSSPMPSYFPEQPTFNKRVVSKAVYFDDQIGNFLNVSRNNAVENDLIAPGRKTLITSTRDTTSIVAQGDGKRMELLGRDYFTDSDDDDDHGEIKKIKKQAKEKGKKKKEEKKPKKEKKEKKDKK